MANPIPLQAGQDRSAGVCTSRVEIRMLIVSEGGLEPHAPKGTSPSNR
jgi:hypothetical protein